MNNDVMAQFNQILAVILAQPIPWGQMIISAIISVLIGASIWAIPTMFAARILDAPKSRYGDVWVAEVASMALSYCLTQLPMLFLLPMFLPVSLSFLFIMAIICAIISLIIKSLCIGYFLETSFFRGLAISLLSIVLVIAVFGGIAGLIYLLMS